MKAIAGLIAVIVTALMASEATDRAAITKVIEAVNDPAQRPRQFTSDAEIKVDFDRLIDRHLAARPGKGLPVGADETWRRLTEPRIVVVSIRFPKPDAATVDAASVVRGAVTFPERVPMVFVLKKDEGRWRISAVRWGRA